MNYFILGITIILIILMMGTKREGYRIWGYSQGNKNKSQCPPGGRITSIEECRRARKALGFKSGWALERPNEPLQKVTYCLNPFTGITITRGPITVILPLLTDVMTSKNFREPQTQSYWNGCAPGPISSGYCTTMTDAIL